MPHEIKILIAISLIFIGLVFILGIRNNKEILPMLNLETLNNKNIRKPAVAGQFYPKDPTQLNNQIDTYLDQAKVLNANERVKILFVPHAGIEYSGNTAAWGFKQIENMNHSRVIILGPSHQTPLTHVAIYEGDAWETPLGTVDINKDLVSRLVSKEENIIRDTTSHEYEHSLEVELIFLQKVLKDFTIVPILIGHPSDELVENLAKKIANTLDNNTLLIISTDLSHYPSWDVANSVDELTINSILTGSKSEFESTIKKIQEKKYPNLATCACGYDAIRVGLRVAEILDITHFEKIKYENSGDITNTKNQVVGYASIGAWKKSTQQTQETHPEIGQLTEETKKEALNIARKTLEEYLTSQKKPNIDTQDSILLKPLGAFVTLKKNNQLRGCIGEFESKDPLYKVIQKMTMQAATKDTRFEPVNILEIPDIKIEISILTPKRKISSWKEIDIEKHGIVVQKGFRNGAFLPQVAKETNWDREKLLTNLCTQKAKLTSDCYKDSSVNLYVFEAIVFGEEE